MNEALTAELRTPGTLEAGAGQAKLLQGPRGEPGAVYVPSVTDGVISWTNDAGLENPAPADITGPSGPQGPAGPRGEAGAGLKVLGQYPSLAELQAAVSQPEPGDSYYVGAAAPYDIYTWGSSGGVQQWINGGALQGPQGADGTTFTPSLSEDGLLSWTNDGGKPNPSPVSVRGPQGAPGQDGAPASINGVNALTLAAGQNVEIEQDGSTVTLSATGALIVTVSGSAGTYTADKTCEQMYAARQAGMPVFALWQGEYLMPYCIEQNLAYFTCAFEDTRGTVKIEQQGGYTSVSCEQGGIPASGITYDNSETGLNADNVQDAIYQILSYLGMV